MSSNPLSFVLDASSFVGPGEAMEDEVTPLDFQLDLAPGRHAIAATSNTPLERDWVIVTLLDPEQYAEAYPDWEERLTFKAHVLCQADSMEGQESYTGWFSRLKLVPISEEEYQSTREWVPDNWPDLAGDPPDWIVERFDAFADALSERAPKRVPVSIQCPHCGARKVRLEVALKREYIAARCGTVTNTDGSDLIVPVSDVEVDVTFVAHLHCTNCGAYTKPLNDDEWKLPGITN